MSNCDNYPTPNDAKRFKNNANSTNEFVTSENDTFTDQDGDEHLTIEGIKNTALDIVVGQAGYILPPATYMPGDQIVSTANVDPNNGMYAVNQVFDYNGGLFVYADTTNLPYTLPAVFPGEPTFVSASVGVLATQKSYLVGSPDHPAGTQSLKPLDQSGDEYMIAGNTYLYRGAARQIEGVHYTISADKSSFDLVDSIFNANEDIFIGFNYFAYGYEPDAGSNVVEWVIPTVASFADFNSSTFPDLVKVTTQQHTSNGVGSSTYIKALSGTPDAFGFVVQDSVGQLWMIDTKETGELFFEQLGALDKDLGGSDIGPIVQKAIQVQSVVGCTLNHESSGEFLFETSAGPMMSGENSTKIIVDKPLVKWNGFSSSNVFTMLEAPLSVAEGVRVEGLVLIPSTRTESVVPNPILDPEGYKNAVSWGIDWSRCRNGSNLSKIRFVAGGNGIVATDLYYSSMSDIDLRGISPDGVGLLEYALSTSTQVNGVNHRNIKLHNGKHNLLCIAADGVFVDANTYENIYIENSIGVAAYFKGWKNTILINPYFENNAPNVASTGTTDIFARDSSITIFGGLINSPSSGASDTESVAHEGGGFIKLDGGVRLNSGNRAQFSRGNIIWGDAEGVNFTTPGSRSQLSSMRAGNQSLVEAKRDSKYDEQTTLPLAYSIESDDQVRVLWVVDLTTSQFRESYMFDVDITSVQHNTTNQGCVTMRLTVRKSGSTYSLNTDIYGEVKNLSSNFGTYSASMSGSQVLIRFSPSAEIADTRAVLNPILCGNNFRVTEILEGY